jgi:hypothetical protein
MIKVRKVRGQDSYRVFNAKTGEIYSSETSRQKALAQKKLLEDKENKEEEKIDDVVDKTKETIEEPQKKVVKKGAKKGATKKTEPK